MWFETVQPEITWIDYYHFKNHFGIQNITGLNKIVSVWLTNIHFIFNKELKITNIKLKITWTYKSYLPNITQIKLYENHISR